MLVAIVFPALLMMVVVLRLLRGVIPLGHVLIHLLGLIILVIGASLAAHHIRALHLLVHSAMSHMIPVERRLVDLVLTSLLTEVISVLVTKDWI